MASVRTLLVDNYDSYTFNLFQQFAVVNGIPPVVIRNDQLTWMALEAILPLFDNVVISPGPGRPDVTKDFGVCRDIIERAQLPVLGVCLGHQGIATAYGGKVVIAPEPMHGRVSTVRHSECDELFAGIPPSFQVVRYHSLMVKDLPECLSPFAWSDDGVVMALRHSRRPLWGVQFHPESVCTHYGDAIARNLRDISLRLRAGHSRPPLTTEVVSFLESLSVVPVSHAEGRLAQIAAASACANGGTGSVCCEGTLDGDCGLTVLVRKVELRESSLPFDSEATFVALYAQEMGAFWLDSSKVEKGLSRFSFMGACNGPRGSVFEYAMRERTVTCGRVSPDGAWEEASFCLDEGASFFDYVECEQRKWATARTIDESSIRGKATGERISLPFDFACGFVGYFGYELGAECSSDPNCLERQLAKEPSDMPDAAFVLCDRAIAFDHEEGSVYVLAACRMSSEEELLDARVWMDVAECAVRTPSEVKQAGDASTDHAPRRWSGSHAGRFTLERSRETYIDDVFRCLGQIARGESYELCLTTHLRAPCKPEPLALYRRLRRTNPAPHAAFLSLPHGRALCGSSPELFLRMGSDRVVESKPIKGTLPRGRTPAEDERHRQQLATSQKDFSENLMIVDLIRNDLGRVCEVGSVHTPTLMSVESYATVHQLVSTVRGTLRPGLGAIDAIKSCFPPGSMTGAPKQRSVEILDGLERYSRGVYSGCLGFLSLTGAMDFNVIIRTVVVSPSGVSIGAGGAVVALSDPVAEFGEMLLKARAPVASVLASLDVPLSSLEVAGLSLEDMAMMRPPTTAPMSFAGSVGADTKGASVGLARGAASAHA